MKYHIHRGSSFILVHQMDSKVILIILKNDGGGDGQFDSVVKWTNILQNAHVLSKYRLHIDLQKISLTSGTVVVLAVHSI